MTFDKEHEELFLKCIDKWGLNAQLDILIEEMSELTKEVIKMRRNNIFLSEEFIKEVVDVNITLNQFITLIKHDPEKKEIYTKLFNEHTLHKIDYIKKKLNKSN